MLESESKSRHARNRASLVWILNNYIHYALQRYCERRENLGERCMIRMLNVSKIPWHLEGDQRDLLIFSTPEILNPRNQRNHLTMKLEITSTETSMYLFYGHM